MNEVRWIKIKTTITIAFEINQNQTIGRLKLESEVVNLSLAVELILVGETSVEEVKNSPFEQQRGGWEWRWILLNETWRKRVQLEVANNPKTNKKNVSTDLFTRCLCNFFSARSSQCESRTRWFQRESAKDLRWFHRRRCFLANKQRKRLWARVWAIWMVEQFGRKKRNDEMNDALIEGNPNFDRLVSGSHSFGWTFTRCTDQCQWGHFGELAAARSS